MNKNWIGMVSDMAMEPGVKSWDVWDKNWVMNWNYSWNESDGALNYISKRSHFPFFFKQPFEPIFFKQTFEPCMWNFLRSLSNIFETRKLTIDAIDWNVARLKIMKKELYDWTFWERGLRDWWLCGTGNFESSFIFGTGRVNRLDGNVWCSEFGPPTVCNKLGSNAPKFLYLGQN